MAIEARPLAEAIGAEISGLQLSALSEDDKKSLYAAFLAYGLLMIRGLDVLTLLPSEYLIENEVAAAALADQDQIFNP